MKINFYYKTPLLYSPNISYRAVDITTPYVLWLFQNVSNLTMF